MLLGRRWEDGIVSRTSGRSRKYCKRTGFGKNVVKAGFIVPANDYKLHGHTYEER